MVIKPIPSTVELPIDEKESKFLENVNHFNKTNLNNLLNTSLYNNNNYNVSPLINVKKGEKFVKNNAHFIYKKKLISNDEEELGGDFASLKPGNLMKNSTSWKIGKSNYFSINNNEKNKRIKRKLPETIWPEVLLVVDYDSYLLHGGNSYDVHRYFIGFWNGVDLRYKSLTNPNIRINLAGMIIAKVIYMSFFFYVFSHLLSFYVHYNRIEMLHHI